MTTEKQKQADAAEARADAREAKSEARADAKAAARAADPEKRQSDLVAEQQAIFDKATSEGRSLSGAEQARNQAISVELETIGAQMRAAAAKR